MENFRREINDVCTLTESDLEERVHIDVPMPVSHVSMDFLVENWSCWSLLETEIPSRYLPRRI